MRGRRYVLFGMLFAACRQPRPARTPDAEARVPDADPRVVVLEAPPSTWPLGSNCETVTFFEPSSAPLSTSSCGADCTEADMPAGGSIELCQDLSSSPTDTVLNRWTIRGVRAGDRFDFATDPSLPADCSTTSVAPPPSDVDAWMTRSKAGCTSSGLPPVFCDQLTEIGSGGDPPTDAAAAIEWVVCPNEIYDDIRTAYATEIVTSTPPLY